MTYPEIEDNPRIKTIDDAIGLVERSTDSIKLNKALEKTNAVLNEFEANPTDPKVKKLKAHVYVHMGAIYSRMGNETKGQEMYTEASKLNINDPDIPINIDDKIFEEPEEHLKVQKKIKKLMQKQGVKEK